MTLFALIALFGWIPFVVVLFAIMPTRQAAAAAVVGAWLVLPPFAVSIAGLPDFTKSTCAAIGIVLGTVVFGGKFALQFRPRWYDLPMLLWCCCGIGTSLQNGLGLYDGLAAVLGQALLWGLPYLAGRLYFSNLEGLRILTVAMVIGGLSYVLPCVWEMRMSPQLMRQIYGLGYSGDVLRLAGYRPHGFFLTGLECGLWMSAAALVGWWLYRCGALKRIGPFRFSLVLVSVLIGTAILCRSTGAVFLLVGGVFVLWASTRLRTQRLLWALVFFLPIYVGLRVPNIWSGDALVSFFNATLGPDRASSLEFRFMCEKLLIRKAMEAPVWGWGGGRNYAYVVDDEIGAHSHLYAGQQVPMDGLWINTFGTKGFVGLSLLYLILELPVMLFLVRFPVRLWSDPRVAPAAVAATLLCLYMIDCTVNGFINIIYISLAGGLISITLAGAGLQPDHGISSSVVSRIAVTDRYRELGRGLRSRGLWADAYRAWQQALATLTELSARHPDHPELLRRWCDCANDVAWLLLNHPDLDSRGTAYALSLAAQVMGRCPDGEVYRNTLGAAYLRNGDPVAAIAVLEGAAASSNAENPFNQVFLAMAYAQLGDREKAGHWLAQATLLKERGYQNHHELAGFCDEAYIALRV